MEPNKREVMDIRKKNMRLKRFLYIIFEEVKIQVTDYNIFLIIQSDHKVRLSPRSIYYTLFSLDRKNIMKYYCRVTKRCFALTAEGQAFLTYTSNNIDFGIKWILNGQIALDLRNLHVRNVN